MLSKKIKETTAYQLIKIIFITIFSIVLLLNLTVAPFIIYNRKKDFLLPNVALLCIFLVFYILILLIYIKYKNILNDFIVKYANRFVTIGSLILFCMELYVSYNIYFLTDWDAGCAIIPTVKKEILRVPFNNPDLYYSTFPNNLLIVWIYTIIIKVNGKIGIFSNLLMPIITVNCFISSLSGYLTYKSVQKLINKKWALFSWFLYLVLVGNSPWVVITYSDSLALFLPILIFYIYTRKFNEKLIILKWFLITCFSIIGYFIKPQTVIILIAIIMIEAWRFIFIHKQNKIKVCCSVLAIILAFFFSITVTVRIAYCKRLALRKGFQLTEAKMNDNLFVLGQFDPLDQADEHFPV